jgi:hypothetical protein
MVALANKLGVFGEVGSYTSKIKSKEKTRDNQDLEKQLRKETKKKQPSSNSVTSSHYLFKMEVKVDIKPY